MEYGYGIQKLDEKIANRKAYDQKKLSIHFQNLESVNPEDYETSGKSALTTLQEFCQNGALIALDYSTIDKTGLYIGKIEAGTKIELEKIKDKWYKTVQVIELRKRTYLDYPLLNIKPIKQTVCRWRILDYRLEYIYEEKELPIELDSLVDKQLEVICSEYMQMYKIIHAPILKIGGSQSKIDISGIGTNERKVFAQVSFKVTEEKIEKLKIYGSPNSLLFYFGPEASRPEASRLEESSINYISIEEVFEALTKYRCSSYYDMIREMLLKPKKKVVLKVNRENIKFIDEYVKNNPNLGYIDGDELIRALMRNKIEEIKAEKGV